MLDLSYFQKKYKHSINKGLSMHNLKSLRKFIDFDFNVYLPSINKDLQRPLCWTMLQKESFIKTP